ncbi:hypothetical protein DFH09DRAFT_1089963 [Mycena vulgaris]|nr:hypothetical protein DFH09DRAFT_1089963 [Mycena vulgaris]
MTKSAATLVDRYKLYVSIPYPQSLIPHSRVTEVLCYPHISSSVKYSEAVLSAVRLSATHTSYVLVPGVDEKPNGSVVKQVAHIVYKRRLGRELEVVGHAERRGDERSGGRAALPREGLGAGGRDNVDRGDAGICCQGSGNVGRS